jgi:DNA-directed RNA polymerase subunit RPC12/RpoP
MKNVSPIDIEYVLGGVRAKCSNCKNSIIVNAYYNNTIIGEEKYCNNCGGKIDWSILKKHNIKIK